MQKKTRLYLNALRLDRWPRSLAIVPGIVAVFVIYPHLLKKTDLASIFLTTVMAFILTWFISTANYIINEITDAPFDAYHPEKKDRPLVKKEISKKYLIILWSVLVLIVALTSYFYFNSLNVLYSLIALLIAGLFYNVPPIRIKDVPFLDSTLESANNPIRFLIGWYTINNNFPSLFLLGSWWAFGNFLMVGKRVAEKKFLTEEESTGYRLSLKRYSLNSLIAFMIVNGLIFIACFVIFAIQSGLKTLLYSVPFILIYLIMFFKKSIQDIEGAEEPEKLLKNPYFALYTLFLVILFVFAYFMR